MSALSQALQGFEIGKPRHLVIEMGLPKAYLSVQHLQHFLGATQAFPAA